MLLKVARLAGLVLQRYKLLATYQLMFVEREETVIILDSNDVFIRCDDLVTLHKLQHHYGEKKQVE